MYNVVAWKPRPGHDLPEPVITDDKAAFPVELVKMVNAWLDEGAAEYERLHEFEPTPQVVGITRSDPDSKMPDGIGGVQYDKRDAKQRIQSYEWERGVIEVNMRQKATGMVLARFYYMCARELGAAGMTGRVIVGKRVREQSKGRITVG